MIDWTLSTTPLLKVQVCQGKREARFPLAYLISFSKAKGCTIFSHCGCLNIVIKHPESTGHKSNVFGDSVLLCAEFPALRVLPVCDVIHSIVANAREIHKEKAEI